MTAAVTPADLGGSLVDTKRGFAAIRSRLGTKHFLYAALAGLFVGSLGGVGQNLGAGSVDWFDLLTTVGLYTFVALMFLPALAIAAEAPPRGRFEWLPFVLAAMAATIIGTTLNFVLYFLFSPTTIPTRRLIIGVSKDLLFFAIPFTLAALAYWRGLDAWRRATALRQLQLERTGKARKAYESKLQALQARVDPRFLFETLASIETTYEADDARGERMIDDLIAYLRAALPTLEDDTSLDAEIALVRTWLDLMRMRHGERLVFSIAVPDAERDARMPPMVLQPLVQHAVESIIEGAFDRPRVAIAIERTGDRLRIAITATGPAFSDGAATPAIAAIRERLAGVYGTNASLAFRWAAPDDSRAELEIPHERADRNHR